MIKGIAFDWGGVLFENPAAHLIAYCAEHLDIPSEILSKELEKHMKDFQTGRVEENALWNKICTDLNIQLPSVKTLWRNAVDEVFIERPEVFNLANNLRKNGYVVGFLSNTEIPVVDYAKQRNYKAKFDTMLYSCIENVAKPEEEIYKRLSKKMNLKPEEIIFIDDNDSYIDGARKAGLHTIQYRSFKQVIEGLHRLGVRSG